MLGAELGEGAKVPGGRPFFGGSPGVAQGPKGGQCLKKLHSENPVGWWSLRRALVES